MYEGTAVAWLAVVGKQGALSTQKQGALKLQGAGLRPAAAQPDRHRLMCFHAERIGGINPHEHGGTRCAPPWESGKMGLENI